MDDKEKVLKLWHAILLVLQCEKDEVEHLDDFEFREYIKGFLTDIIEDERLKP